jgi:hypothetical protein
MVLLTSAFGSFLVLIQGQNGEIRGFFSAQARSMMMGHFYVNETGDMPGECYIYENKCFGYFGITPSLLRMPFLFFRRELNFTSTSLIVAITLGIIASFLLLDKVASLLNFWNNNSNRSSKLQYALALVAVGPGSLFLQLTRPAGQWESIAWGSTFSTLGIFSIVSWFLSRKNLHLVISFIFFTLAANARITNGLIALAVALTCLVPVSREGTSRSKRTIGCLSLVGVLPTLSALIVLYLKFDTFFPKLTLHVQVPEGQNWAQILDINGGKTVGIAFVLTNLVTYFRPDSLVLTNFTDLVTLRPTYFPVLHIPPLNKGGMWNEPTASVTNIMPVFVLMALYLFKSRFKSVMKRKKSNLNTISPIDFVTRVALACFAGLIVTLTFVTSSNRYLGDFLPGASLVTIVGLLLIFEKKNKEKISTLYWSTVILIFLGTITNLLTALTRARNGTL